MVIEKSKYEVPFSIKILDSNFDLVSLVSYSAVQWNRNYNEPGTFTVEGVRGDFDKSTWKYVYTEQRRELGRITQINWKKDGNKQTLTLSGVFIEDDLNKMICYAKPTHFDDDEGTHAGTSILSTGSPTWVTASGTADEVAEAFFEGFKQVSIRNYPIDGSEITTTTFDLGIEFGYVEDGDYHRSVHNRNNEHLGSKLYKILKPSGASYMVEFDYETKVQTLHIIHGIDRTQEGHEYGVNPITFSSRNGTIKSARIVTSTTDTKDAVIQYSEDETQTLILANVANGSLGRFTVEQMKSSQSDFEGDDTGHKLAVMADASSRLEDLVDKINLQFDFVASSYRYMEDFDLGDKVSVEIPEMDLSVDAQIVACHEVIKNGTWSLDMEIGSSTIRKRGKI
jgi:hypothetical protein